jgi:MbtH protein
MLHIKEFIVNPNTSGERFKVVVNHEEQYSIWPEHKALPLLWREVGKSGAKQECLSYIKDVWTDMRPLSLRKAMRDALDPVNLGNQ